MSNDAVVAMNLPSPEVLAEFELPSGKTCVIRKGTGKDLRLALMAAGVQADQYRIIYAMIARLAKIDGQMVTMEGIDTMDLLDAQKLLAEGGKLLNPTKRSQPAELTLQKDSDDPASSSQQPGSEPSLNGESQP